MKQNRFVLSSLAIAASMILAACGSATPAATTAPAAAATKAPAAAATTGISHRCHRGSCRSHRSPRRWRNRRTHRRATDCVWQRRPQGRDLAQLDG